MFFRATKSCAGLGLSKDKMGMMKNVECMAVAPSSDDELMHQLSMENCNGESKDLMEAVKEGRRASSPANELEEDGRGTENEKLSMFCTLTWTHVDSQILPLCT